MHRWSFSSPMFKYRLVDHAVPAMWRSLAAARLRADFPSGKAPTTRVRRLISRRMRSSGLFVRLRLLAAATCVAASANQCLQANNQAAPMRSSPSHRLGMATGSGHAPAVSQTGTFPWLSCHSTLIRPPRRPRNMNRSHRAALQQIQGPPAQGCRANHPRPLPNNSGLCAAARGSRMCQLQSRPQEFAQGDKWSFCLTAGTLCPANQEKQ